MSQPSNVGYVGLGKIKSAYTYIHIAKNRISLLNKKNITAKRKW